MNVNVIIPYRSQGCPHREAAWKLVRDNWSGWEWYTADDYGEPFSRAASINQGVSDHPADVHVIADADILIAADQVRAAVELAAWSPGLVVAFDRWAHLTEPGTRNILDGYLDSWEPYIDVSIGWSVSACIAVSHETWQLTGGFPPLRAWGMEDVCFEIACRTLAGPTRRIPGTAWHLFHPTETTRPDENVALLRQYEAAADNPHALLALRARV